MYLIDETYFIKELSIPNLKEAQVYGETMEFETWIDKEARQCLKDALGYQNYSELDSYIDNGQLKDEAPEKWKNLVYGASFQLNGVNVKWEGLLIQEGVFKKSLLAQFVYAKWLEFQTSKMTGTGEKRTKSSGSQSVNGTHRYVSVWNQFVTEYQGAINFSQSSISFKNGVRFVDYSSNVNNSFVSLIEYLKNHDDLYPNTTKTLYDYKNTLGL